MRIQCASPPPFSLAAQAATRPVLPRHAPMLGTGFQKTCEPNTLDMMGDRLVDLARYEVCGFAIQPLWQNSLARPVRRTDVLLRKADAPVALLDEWVLRRACRTAAEWPDALTLSLPLSRRVFHSPDLIKVLVEALNVTDLEAARLELRIGERYAAHNSERTRALLFRLRDLGVRIAVECDARSPQRLNFLDLPCDVISLDVATCRDLSSELAALTELGRTLRVTGVSSVPQMVSLCAAGVAQAQGALFGPALPMAQALETTGTVGALLLRQMKDLPPNA